MKKGCHEGTSPRLERKTVEKNRRMHMKSLCFKLSSLLPKDAKIPTDALTQQDHLDHAASYIKNLQRRVEDLKQRKEMVLTPDEIKDIKSCSLGGLKLPLLEIRDIDSTLEVVLICGLNKRFVFYELIAVLEEEGAEVVNASFSNVGDKVFYTIHSKVTFPRIGLEASRVSERLKKLVH